MASTMDTTSHFYTWQIDTFGTHSSVLYDVSIINENDIWAVGEIYSDSTQPWIPYNAVHWNGQEWKLYRITTNSVVGIGYYPIRTVFAFNSSDIWMFSEAGSYCHWNGSQWNTEFISERQGSINKIWGDSSNDLYFVGTNGNITHYSGVNWHRLESGTDIDLRDITGTIDNRVWVSGYTSSLSHSILLDFNGYTWEVKKILQPGDPPDPYIDGTISNIWASPQFLYIISGIGILRESIKTGSRYLYQWEDIGLPIGFSQSTDGTGDNNIFIVGDFGTVLHFNGSTWMKYPFFNLSNGPGFKSVNVTGNRVVVVGRTSGKAIVFLGSR
jgi:hypothetical protein